MDTAGQSSRALKHGDAIRIGSRRRRMPILVTIDYARTSSTSATRWTNWSAELNSAAHVESVRLYYQDDIHGKEHSGTKQETFTEPAPPPNVYQPEKFDRHSLGTDFLRSSPNGAVAYIGCNMVAQALAWPMVKSVIDYDTSHTDPRLGDAWNRGADRVLPQPPPRHDPAARLGAIRHISSRHEIPTLRRPLAAPAAIAGCLGTGPTVMDLGLAQFAMPREQIVPVPLSLSNSSDANLFHKRAHGHNQRFVGAFAGSVTVPILRSPRSKTGTVPFCLARLQIKHDGLQNIGGASSTVSPSEIHPGSAGK